MDPDRRVTRSSRLAPLAQAGLAALVAGSLLTFSALAFNTALDTRGSQQVTASAPRTGAPRPVVLPGTPAPTRAVTTSTEELTAQAIEAPARGDVVLGTRIPKAGPVPAKTKTPRSPLLRRAPRSGSVYIQDTHEDSHRNGNGYGHIKARGKGHHKEKKKS